MNELELIRSQLGSERSRATQVALACVRAHDRWQTDEFHQARIDYLVFVLSRFDERDQIVADLYRTRLTDSQEDRRQLESIVRGPGAGREALILLETALSANAAEAPARWQEFSEYLAGAWRERRDSVDALLARNPRITDWRAVSFVDADSIVEERALYARTQSSGSGPVP